MIVEELRFRVKAGTRDLFVERNERVWTPALRERPGFRGREVLFGRGVEDEVVVRVYWRAADDMEAFPSALEEELDRRMGDLVVERERRLYERVLGEDPRSGD